jgi:hypothetical protein
MRATVAVVDERGLAYWMYATGSRACWMKIGREMTRYLPTSWRLTSGEPRLIVCCPAHLKDVIVRADDAQRCVAGRGLADAVEPDQLHLGAHLRGPHTRLQVADRGAQVVVEVLAHLAAGEGADDDGERGEDQEGQDRRGQRQAPADRQPGEAAEKRGKGPGTRHAARRT